MHSAKKHVLDSVSDEGIPIIDTLSQCGVPLADMTDNSVLTHSLPHPLQIVLIRHGADDVVIPTFWKTSTSICRPPWPDRQHFKQPNK